ncbi:response regulator [Shewanella phaeophyticola]|uniref:Response regulator n=1 Tax=Shewanella phaeophyticola TaxID=2978345 RepID=A0ABT2P4U4_9GAMM|nr:response regulator [Shewanella sp. KJ10-1]MCT8987648.1 response regulator [Shewanella sp. KJ10-1]
MTNILIVEDQEEKSNKLYSFCTSKFIHKNRIDIEQSLRGGLKKVLLNKDYDLIFLDMSMPNFDPSSDDPLGGSPESFAGLEFVSQLKLRGIFIPVVVVTQYRTFEEGKIDLGSIDNHLTSEYGSYYLGSVYYSSADRDWEKPLLNTLKKAKVL